MRCAPQCALVYELFEHWTVPKQHHDGKLDRPWRSLLQVDVRDWLRMPTKQRSLPLDHVDNKARLARLQVTRLLLPLWSSSLLLRLKCSVLLFLHSHPAQAASDRIGPR